MAAPEQATLVPCAKHSFRVLNEPFKFFGIIDWRYAFAAAVPSVLFGFLAHSKIAAIIVLCVLSWKSYAISQNDPNLPMAWWVTLWDKRKLCCFSKGGR